MTASLFRVGILFACAAVLAAARAGAAEATFAPPSAADVLKTLKPGHPRLLIDGETVARVRKLVEADPVAAAAYRQVKAEADKVLGQPASKYEIPDGRRLLRVSRRVKERVRTLAFIFLAEGGRKYVDRAWAELEAAAKFKDWNPAHFLDTAEMTHALALGYDWLHEQWTPDQRRTLREAIVRLGLRPAWKVYEAVAE